MDLTLTKRINGRVIVSSDETRRTETAQEQAFPAYECSQNRGKIAGFDTPRLRWISVQERSRCHIERLGQPFHHRNRRVSPAPLDVTDVGAMDARPVGVILLAPTFLLAETTHILAEAVTDVHGAPTTPVSAINLQTISDIGVDLRPARSLSVRH